MEPLANLKNLKDFSGLIVKLASWDEITKWSRGEITKPETINYRTLKPEKDGLFDERIFGPTKDWECYCGKYKKIRYKGVTCDKCGVEVTQSRVRRERMGHITLATPVAHVWYFKGSPSKVSLVLNIAPKAIEQVIYFARYLVMDINAEKRVEAKKIIEKAKSNRIDEITLDYTDRGKTLVDNAESAKLKLTEKIKNKEQLSMAISEVELELRKKQQLMEEEKVSSLDRTTKIFDGLISLVKSLKKYDVLSEEENDQLLDFGAGDFFEAKMGAEAVLTALSEVDLDRASKEIKEEILKTKESNVKFIKLTKRLKVVNGLRKAKINPSWMIMKVIPVIPPDLRPMVQLSGGRFATSDLNDLYRRVINRNNRLKHLIGLGAPEIILRNEKRMLQEAVDSLIDTSQKKAVRKGRTKQTLRSLSDMLRGKQGRFRQNLLGKRVDYSGRSVIVVGPELRLNQCGIPKDMALEMFKPFVLREMILRGIAPNVKSAKNMLEHRPPEVFDILEEITKDHPVLLNRAPTLHKLGILAFYPVLIEGEAIRLHPAVCNGFNADFDGDQMAVHIPLSEKAKNEARTLMMPEHNWLKPADGVPIAIPSRKEMALGVYYLTVLDDRIPAYETVFSSEEEAFLAYANKLIALRQSIKVRIGGHIEDITIGRLMFNRALPENFMFINAAVPSSTIKEIFTRAFKELPNEKVVEMIDAIKSLGFLGGTLSGFSFGVFDALMYADKDKVLAKAEKRVAEIEDNFGMGLITTEEKKRLSQEVWIETTEEVADRTWELLDKYNPIRVVVDAKVGRTSKAQVKQLAAIRGLVVDPLGKIVELPIKSNFREGLSVFEYVTSSRGSRKGLTDTALKTADAGYLTRRLVDVAHDFLTREEDCGTKEGLVIKRHPRPQVFGYRILGRVLAKDVVIPGSKKPLAVAGDMVDEELSVAIDKSKLDEVTIFSPLTCEAKIGVCGKCYGWDLSTHKPVTMGTPVGVIAAQSIGEPGTQLTLQTKHAAGVVGVDVTKGLPRVEELFEARTPKSLSPISEIDGKVKVVDGEDGWVVTVTEKASKLKEEKKYVIPKTIKLAVATGDEVMVGTPLAEGSLDLKNILTVLGLRSAQEYLVSEIQAVYESQGIPISDKHFEVIVRKMSDILKISSSGDTSFLPGEIVNRVRFMEENKRVLASGGEPSVAKQIILGITRRSINTESWLSAASFEQTTDVLTEVSLEAKEDHLIGLKENVIIGKKIPVGVEEEVIAVA